MFFRAKNIEISISELDSLRSFLKQVLSQAQSGNMNQEEMIKSLESCFSPDSPLSWEDAVIMRPAKKD